MDELLTIGRFSRMCWLSIKALRFYDEAGLLHPARVDPATNYRSYAPEQAPLARAIAILRSLDIPVAEIRDLVTETDPDKVRARLDAHRATLEERIVRNRHMLERVEYFIRKGAVMTHEITIREIQPVDVVGVTLTTSPETIGTDITGAYGRLFSGIGRAGIAPMGPPRVVYLEMADDSWTIEACVPVAGGSAAPEGLSLHHVEGGRAAATIHVGPYDELGMAYREIEVWIEKQGMETAGPPYDVYLNDPNEVKDPAKYQTEIVWPVR